MHAELFLPRYRVAIFRPKVDFRGIEAAANRRMMESFPLHRPVHSHVHGYFSRNIDAFPAVAPEM
jgi:hypothetical protein